MAVIDGGSNTAGKANVDANFNLQVVTPTTPTNSGYVKIAGPDGTPMLIGLGGEQIVTLDMPLFQDNVDGAVVNTNQWNQATVTMAIAQANSVISLNSGNSVAINASAQINTIKTFSANAGAVLYANVAGVAVNLPASNSTAEIFLGTATGTSAPTDGVGFRWTPAGTFQAFVNFNGTETTALLTTPNANRHEYIMVIQSNVTTFLVDGAQVAAITTPGTQPFQINSSRVPLTARVYTGGSAPALAPRLDLARFNVQRGRTWENRFWDQSMIQFGRGAYQSPLTAFGQTANHANSTSPASATLSNTAAGYTTLGGRWQYAAIAGVATDAALFGFQVPAGFQLVVKQFRFDAVNTGAAVATTATIADVGVGLNSSAVSLATVDGAGTWAPRRIPLGHMSWIIADAIGAASRNGPINLNLDGAPWVVDSQRFFHVIIQNYVGTATAAQVIRGDCFVGGFFD